MSARIPNALTIAGIDPSGGAGIYADLKAFSAHGAYATGVVAALTAQNTRAVTGVQGIDPAFIRLQIDTLLADVRIDTAKIGMLGTAAIAQAVAEALSGRVPPYLVLDPVMVSKSGDALLSKDATAMLIEAVVPLASLITPNLPETGVLLGRRAPESLAEMYMAAERLRRLLPDDPWRWVLVKGGHLPGDPIDLLHDGDQMFELPARRVDSRNTHGTGCTLSAAITALLPQRSDVLTAVQEAKTWLTEAIRRSGELSVGGGHGPVHHFHGLWNGLQRG